LAFSFARVRARVPEEVTGEPETIKIEGADRLTEVTVPPPPPPPPPLVPSPEYFANVPAIYYLS
jgi:hypothetical protein